MFKPGRGFYELVKPVEVQSYKEVLLVDRRTGDIFNGPQVRHLLGLSPQNMEITKGGPIEKLKPVVFDKFKVFIQSTSYNRKLIPGTNLMYEIPDWDMIPSEMEEPYKAPTPKMERTKTIKPPVAKAVPADPKFRTPIEPAKKPKAKKEVVEKTDVVTFVVTAEVKYTLVKGKTSMLRSMKNKLKEIQEISTDGAIKVKTVK